jgi:hypothetical protein
MFRCTIRELVLVTIIVGMTLCWWLDRTALSKQGVRPTAREERYELVETGKENEKVYLFNARAGEMWGRYNERPGEGAKWWPYTASVEESKKR